MPLDCIDMHVHFGAPGDPARGDPCYWSEEFTRSAAYKAFRLITGTWLTKLDLAKAKKLMIRAVESAEMVDSCVLLALDQVYDESGRPHLKDRTHLYVSNEVIRDLAEENPELFFFGASVHPYRPDWRDRLDAAIADGAVLCKWLPSAQQIDPSHPLCEPFYEKLAAHKLPLLCHAGPELSIPTSDHAFDVFNNPKYLEKALRAGVPVIVAHCALPFDFPANTDLDTFEPYRELIRLVRLAETEGWPVYADLSALLFFRDRYIRRVIADIPPHRLLFGSDYPIPMSDLAYKEKLSFPVWLRRFWRSLTQKNLLDKNYLLLQDMGFDPSVFSNAVGLFAGIRRTL
ncbi:MAG: amidohydrolase family protein [Candidatus Aminicenantales bacterium]|jgi:predicted TIM-barrel fold metal-dependent hydrolase